MTIGQSGAALNGPAPVDRGNVVVTQTVALFIDAYRELNAKRLFWITLWLSLAVVATFAFVSITPTGFKIFVWDIPSFFNSTIIPADTFYKFLFTQWAIPWWLGVAASILALISVASVFPDFITGGSIDLYLARPIGRLRLFVTKYLTGLLFVALQVLLFCAASFFVIGVKGHVWEFGIFLAVPLVTAFFSYLYCVCVLMGLITRSTLAAILVTLLFWFGLFALNSSSNILLTFRTISEERQMRMSENIASWDHMISQQKALAPERQSAGALKNFEFHRDGLLTEKRGVDTTVGQLQFWSLLIEHTRAPLPKTDESIKLMNRWLIEPDPIMKAQAQRRSGGAIGAMPGGRETGRSKLLPRHAAPACHRLSCSAPISPLTIRRCWKNLSNNSTPARRYVFLARRWRSKW